MTAELLATQLPRELCSSELSRSPSLVSVESPSMGTWATESALQSLPTAEGLPHPLTFLSMMSFATYQTGYVYLFPLHLAI